MRDPCNLVRTTSGAILLLLAACGSSNSRRPPNVGTGSDLVDFVQPRVYGARQVEVVGVDPGVPPRIEGDTTQATGLMPPRVGADLHVDGVRVTAIDGLDVALATRTDDPDFEVLTHRNSIDGNGVAFELDRRSRHGDATGSHLQLALQPDGAGNLVGMLRYRRSDEKAGVDEGATYRIVFAPRGLDGGR